MTSIAIIGGGIAGVSAAAALAPHTSVTLYETEPALGYHASGRSAAMFEENYGNDAVRALNSASKPEHIRRGVLSPRGILMVATREEEDDFEHDLKAMGMSEINLGDAKAMVPILSDAVIRAALHKGASDLDTDALLQGYAREARVSGAQIVTSAEATARSVNDAWTVTASGTTQTFDLIVNAAGAWADRVAKTAGVSTIGLSPLRRSVARLPAPGGHDVRGWPMLFGPGESWYAKPDAGAWIVSPAEEDPSEPMDAWADDMVLAEGIARYQPHVTEDVTRVETSWAGLRTFAPDRSLVIGQDPNAKGLYWLAGQGGYGFQTAPAAAKLLADIILNRPPEPPQHIVDALSPKRFA